MDSIPKELHRNLYYTLFESSYCISVWGGATKFRIQNLWTTQKQCIRILFGDKESYRDKFNTCARARPYNQQILTNEFYTPQHTKPLFESNKILSVQNLYTYHCYMETYKILKFRQPMSLYDNFNISERKPALLIAGLPTQKFIDRATSIWNTVTPKLKLDDLSLKVSSIKDILKKALLTNQHRELPLVWISDNFDCSKICFATN